MPLGTRSEDRPDIDLELVLTELGSFGRFQLRFFALLLITLVWCGIFCSQYIFTAFEVKYRCLVPECEADPPEIAAEGWREWALPSDPHCKRYAPLAYQCAKGSFSSETIRCHSWIYEHMDSIVSEFNLACASWKRTLVGSIRSIGMFLALLWTGPFSDTFGRRHALIITMILHTPPGVWRAYSTSYIMFIGAEFVESLLGSGTYTTGYILVLEMISCEKRVLMGNLMCGCYATGQMVLGLLAYLVPNWRKLLLIIYAPDVIFLIYYFLIPESIRWLISKGRHDEAKSAILRIANANKVKLSDEVLRQLDTLEISQPKMGQVSVVDDDEHPASLAKRILRSKIIMSRLCICSYWWIAMTFIYYGLSINAVSLGSNMYLSFGLTSLMEMPGYAMSFMALDRFGRKSSIMTAFLVSGLAMTSLGFLPDSFALPLALCAKMCMATVTSSIYIYTIELFPTEARHSMLAVCSMVGRVGGALAPQTPLLMEIFPSLPYLIFGGMAIGASLLMTLTPETLNMKLPDTVAEVEEMAYAPHDSNKIDMIFQNS